MDINQLMNSLKETYGFSKTEWNELNGEPPCRIFPVAYRGAHFPLYRKSWPFNRYHRILRQHGKHL